MMDKKIILGYTRRLLAIIPSIFFCALGVALLVSPEWGSDPLTTFEIGLSNVFQKINHVPGILFHLFDQH